MNPLTFQRCDEPQPIVYSPRLTTDYEYSVASLRRFQAIINEAKVLDPLIAERNGLIGDGLASDESNYVLIPSRFLELARNRKPSNPEATASAFANWVYSLTSPSSTQNIEAMAKGLMLESWIEKRRTWLSHAMHFVGVGDMPVSKESEWRLVHNGLHSEELIPWEGRKPGVPYFYEIEDLRVGDLPLRASPDLVFQNKRTKDILIVEIKFSERPIPPKLWPNVWAQLWAYSQIPTFREASRVTVIGEIWGEWFSEKLEGKVVGLRASARRDPRKLAFDRFFRKLFDIYRGGGSDSYELPGYESDMTARAVRVRKQA